MLKLEAKKKPGTSIFREKMVHIAMLTVASFWIRPEKKAVSSINVARGLSFPAMA